MTSTRPIRNRDLAVEIEMLEDALYGQEDSHQTRGTLDSDTAVRLLALLTERRARAATIEGDFEPNIVDPDERRRAPGSAASNQFGTFQVQYASEAQTRFIARLLAEREHAEGNLDPNTVNKRHASDLIDRLMACPMRNGAPNANAPTDKQVALIVKESARREGHVPVTEETARQLTRKAASHILDILFAAPFTPRPQAPAGTELTVGVYRVEGTVYRVYPAKADRSGEAG